MNTVIKIPSEIAKKGNLVLISESDYDEFLRFFKKRKTKEEYIDKAIKIFQKEKKEKKLFKVNSLSEVR